MNLTANDRMALDMGEVLYKLDDANNLLEVVLRWMEDEGGVGTVGREDVDTYKKTAFYTNANVYHTVLRSLRDKLQDAQKDAENTETAIDKLGIWNNPSPQH